jgi:hypothetical protein
MSIIGHHKTDVGEGQPVPRSRTPKVLFAV